MAAATSNPWNETPARRPSAADFGSDANGVFVLADELTDRDGNDIRPVQDGSMLYADMMNRALEAMVAGAATMPALIVTVRFATGVPVVDSFISPRTTRAIEDIECVDDGTGITTVRVVDTTLPPKIGDPTLTINEGTTPIGKAEHYEDTGWRGATVETKELTGSTLTNLRFTVMIF